MLLYSCIYYIKATMCNVYVQDKKTRSGSCLLQMFLAGSSCRWRFNTLCFPIQISHTDRSIFAGKDFSMHLRKNTYCALTMLLQYIVVRHLSSLLFAWQHRNSSNIIVVLKCLIRRESVSLFKKGILLHLELWRLFSVSQHWQT